MKMEKVVKIRLVPCSKEEANAFINGEPYKMVIENGS